nr:hypothetical protein [uncultured Lacibacter sp.]
MKKILSLFLFFSCMIAAFAQRPSKEQIEKDKKEYAEAMKKLNEKTSKMDPKAKKSYDSLLNVFGMGAKINDANQQINNNNAPKTKNSVGLVPEKNTKSIASIATTPSTASMGVYVGNTGKNIFAAVLPAAKNKANEIYLALKEKGSSTDEIGNAATLLWMQGKTQIALALMAQVCSNDVNNTDNLSNYASMLTMMGAPELAIPILNNLNARFKKNTTILNNIGQAWFALGEIEKANKYLDSTLLLNAGHAQANETKCLIAESKGNKTAALAHAKAAFKQGATQQRKDKLIQLGYFPGANDYNHFPPANKSDDLLQLGGFSMPPFPKSVAEYKALEPIWKQFRKDIDLQIKPLQKITEESNKLMAKKMEEQQKQFMTTMNKAVSKPGSVSQSAAMQIVGAPMFAEEMNARENIILQNLQKKKQAAIQRITEFVNGDGAAMKKKYQDAMQKINEKSKDVGEGGSVSNEQLCIEGVKASDEFLQSYNSRLEVLYMEYLTAEKQLLNELSYAALYTSYAEILPGVNAGLKMQWLRALSLTQNGFNFESVTKYECADAADGKNGKLTAFKDPNCNINSDFNVGLKSFGGSIKLDCNGMTTTFNAAAFGVTMQQDLDHAGFGDSFKNCTVSIGPKISAGGKVGPLEASVSAGAGADIEIDRNGISDVVITGSVEAEAGIGPASASAGAEGRMSLNTGAGSVQGTGIFK